MAVRDCSRSLGIDGSDFIGMFDGAPGSLDNSRSSLGRGTFLGRAGRSDSAGGTSGLLPAPPPSSHAASGGNSTAGGSRRDSVGSGWEAVNYDFGNLASAAGLGSGGLGGGGNGGEPFEMDDLGLPFGGLDDLMSGSGSHGGGGGLGSSGGLGSFRRGTSDGSSSNGVSVTAGAAHAAAQGMGGFNSMLPPSDRAAPAGASSAHATRRAVQQSQKPPSHQDRPGHNSAKGSGGGGGGGPRRPVPHHQSAPCAITSAGTVNFPNSTDSGQKFPVSNCVAELPPLQSLPPG
jgi:hypothetical protein